MAEGVASFMTVVTSVITAISSQPVLMACFCAGLVGTAVGVVKRLAH